MYEHDYQEEALSLLLPQFDNSVDLRGFVKGLLASTPSFQSGLNEILAGYSQEAVGAQLDKIGKLLNVERLGRDDAEYLSAIKVRIIINRATGSGANFIDMLQLVLPEDVTFQVFEQFPAAVRVIIYGAQTVITEDVVNEILPIGVEGIFFVNPYEGKTLWVPQEVDAIGTDPAAVLPDVADIDTSDIVLADVFYVN